MIIKLKILLIYLANIGAFPFVAVGLFDFGILQADLISLIWLIVFVELILSTLLLMKIVYTADDPKNLRKTSTLVIIDEKGMVHKRISS